MGSVNALTLVASLASGGSTLWVSPTGADDAPGSRAKPIGNPQVAVSRAKPGDRIVLRGGTYKLDHALSIQVKGTAQAWISLEAAPKERPILDFIGAKPSARFGDQGAVDLRSAAYVRLKGLEVRNSYYAGIFVQRGCKFIDIQNCRVDLTFMPGIGVWNSEDVRIVGNEVTRANDPSMRLFGNPENECPHEAISVAGVKRFEVAWNHVHHSIKEGIDVKEVSAHGTVHHNYVHDLHRQAYYADAWFGRLEDVEFFSNVAHDCEWGQVISAEGKSSELKNVRVHHNLLYRNRASGIYFGTWGGNGPRSGIRIHHNTLFQNGRNGHWAGATGNIDVRASNVRDLTIERNLLADGGAFQIALFTPDRADLKSRGIFVRDNGFQGTSAKTQEASPYGQVYAWLGEPAWTGKIPFRDAKRGDFRLESRMPYGAYPDGAVVLPGPPPGLKGFPAYVPSPSRATGLPKR